MSADQFILYATAIILSSMTVLFCCCHPEIPMVLCMKMKSCCCGAAKDRGSTVRNAVNDNYVGGIQMEKRQDRESEREII
jgi:hypothetical protein